jgi:hypothetical protein
MDHQLGQVRRLCVPTGSCRHDFDSLVPPLRNRVELRRATLQDLRTAAALAGRAIGGQLADLSVVERVLHRNPNSVLLFKRNQSLAGFWSMLFLTPRGLEAMLFGELCLENPQQNLLASGTEEPSAIYIWAVVASGLASEGIRHVSSFLRQPLYARANCYARPATEAGREIIESTGFHLVNSSSNRLHRYVRHANRQFAFAPATKSGDVSHARY